jgi:hypothetical protein
VRASIRAFTPSLDVEVVGSTGDARGITAAVEFTFFAGAFFAGAFFAGAFFAGAFFAGAFLAGAVTFLTRAVERAGAE